jgi:pimeloyl-ACP methyl ester carboxylesterase
VTRTDLVVVLPGILGSTLSRNGHLVWAPSAGSALRAIRTFGASIRQLELPMGIGDDHPMDGVEPVSMMPDLHILPGVWTAVKGYDQLLDRLRSLGYREQAGGPGAPPGNLLPVAYDWRLSCRYNAERLGKLIEPALERWRAQGGPYTEAQVVLVCHSMGGLIARWYIEKCGGAETTRKLITLGTPYRGAARALGQLVNGADHGLGPLRLRLTDFARSMPSSYQLLPEYACMRTPDGLVKITDVTLPDLDTAMTADAMRFHTSLRDAEANRPASLDATHAIVGVRQSTATTAQATIGGIELINAYQDEDLHGDATVPIVAACRADVPLDSNMLRRVPDKHGNLQRNNAALDEVESILTAQHIIVKAVKPIALQADVPEFAVVGENVNVQITPAEPARASYSAVVLVQISISRPGPAGAWRTNTDVSPAWTQATGQPSAVSVAEISMSRADTIGRPLRATICAMSASAPRPGSVVVSSAWMSFSAAVSV